MDDITSSWCDSLGNVAIGGYTNSEGMASEGSFRDYFTGDTLIVWNEDEGKLDTIGILDDGFVAVFNPSGSRLWGSYFGGGGNDQILTLCYDRNDNILIGGATDSSVNIGTPGTFMPEYADSTDGFVAKIGEFLRITNVDLSVCSNNDLSVEYETAVDFQSGNEFTVWLSDSLGSFENEIQIGSLSATGDGTILAKIPENVPPASGYRVRIKSSNPAKTSLDNGQDITIYPLPEPSLSGDNPACSRTSVTYTAEEDSLIQYLWTVSNGTIVSDSSKYFVVVQWEDASGGSISLVERNIETGCVDSVSEDISINVSPNPIINGAENVQAYSQELYSTQNSSHFDYLWKIKGGSIEGDSTNNSVLVNWEGSGVGKVILIVVDKRTDCLDTAVLTVAINAQPIPIEGNKTVCAKSEENYWITPEEGYSYKWTVEGGEIQGSASDTLIVVLWGDPGDGAVKLVRTSQDSSEIDTFAVAIKIIPIPDISIYGLNELCEGETAIYYAPPADSVINLWTVQGGKILGADDGDTAIVKWDYIPNDSLSSTASIVLKRTSLKTGCSNEKIKNVFLSAKPSCEVIGDLTVCENEVKVYQAKDVKNIMSYEWRISGGTIVGSASDSVVQVEWGSAGTGKLALIQTSQSNCEDSSFYDVVINPKPPKPTVEQSGKILISSADEGNQWYVDNVLIKGAVDKYFAPDSSGYYSVQVTDSNGCVSEMSAPYYFDVNEVYDENLSQKIVKIYPNPTNGRIYVEIKRAVNPTFSLTIRNVLGEIAVKATNLQNGDSVDLSALNAGVYFLEIKIGASIYVRKIAKK